MLVYWFGFQFKDLLLYLPMFSSEYTEMFTVSDYNPEHTYSTKKKEQETEIVYLVITI